MNRRGEDMGGWVNWAYIRAVKWPPLEEWLEVEREDKVVAHLYFRDKRGTMGPIPIRASQLATNVRLDFEQDPDSSDWKIDVLIKGLAVEAGFNGRWA